MPLISVFTYIFLRACRLLNVPSGMVLILLLEKFLQKKEENSILKKCIAKIFLQSLAYPSLQNPSCYTILFSSEKWTGIAVDVCGCGWRLCLSSNMFHTCMTRISKIKMDVSERERVGVREWEWESWRTVMRNKIEFIILPPSPLPTPLLYVIF